MHDDDIGDWFPDYYYGGSMPEHPAYPAFYDGKDVVTKADQLKPGLKVTRFDGYDDPAHGGTKMEILSHSYVTHLVQMNDDIVQVDILVYPEGRDPIRTSECIADDGVMPEGERPYNMSRLVLGWDV